MPACSPPVRRGLIDASVWVQELTIKANRTRTVAPTTDEWEAGCDARLWIQPTVSQPSLMNSTNDPFPAPFPASPASAPASTPPPFSPAPTSTATGPGVVEQARKLGEDALHAAQQHVVEPAREAVDKAKAYATQAYETTSKQIGEQFAHAGDYAAQKMDATERWVYANPWPAVAAGFIIGCVVGSSLTMSRR